MARKKTTSKKEEAAVRLTDYVDIRNTPGGYWDNKCAMLMLWGGEDERFECVFRWGSEVRFVEFIPVNHPSLTSGVFSLKEAKEQVSLLLSEGWKVVDDEQFADWQSLMSRVK